MSDMNIKEAKREDSNFKCPDCGAYFEDEIGDCSYMGCAQFDDTELFTCQCQCKFQIKRVVKIKYTVKKVL